jgi:hypothetical protein
MNANAIEDLQQAGFAALLEEGEIDCGGRGPMKHSLGVSFARRSSALTAFASAMYCCTSGFAFQNCAMFGSFQSSQRKPLPAKWPTAAAAHLAKAARPSSVCGGSPSS